MESNEVVIGVLYRHYKGKEYKVIGIARHSETLERLVVYERLYEDGEFPEKLWVRPYDMFLENVEKVQNEFAERDY